MFTTPRMHKSVQNTHTQIADANIKSTHFARNFLLDENITMVEQVKKICQSACF